MHPLGVLLFLAMTAAAFGQPAPGEGGVRIRLATFNAEDVRSEDLADGTDPRLRQLAEVLQRIRPNIVLINEIAYDLPGGPGVDPDQPAGQNGRRFAELYLARSQSPGLKPLRMHAFMAPSNTGMPSGFDLDRNGRTVTEFPDVPDEGQSEAGRAYGGDCWGFGTFPGQYGMALLIDDRLGFDPEAVRTFRLLPWSYMPGALLPRDPDTGEAWYDEEVSSLFRLSSKSHWDVPVTLPNGTTLHLLCSHPTPPAFDGEEMRNRKRNADEIRFWADYLDNAPYIVDDRNHAGGIERGSMFVILGDLNADPDEGSSFKNPIATHLLAHPLIGNPEPPRAELAVDGLEPDDTASFGLRVDYVLPWRGIEVLGSGVWRTPPGGRTGGFPSDHFPVWADLRVPPAPAGIDR